MAEKQSLLSSLKSFLPESSWSWVIPALKHDPLIWDSLHDPKFFSKASGSFSQPEDWSPSRLALLKLDASDLDSINADISKSAQGKLDHYLEVETPPNQEQMSFHEAALIALGLYQRQKTKEWNDIVKIFNSAYSESSGWFSPLAILLAMVTDQRELIKSLLDVHPSTRLMLLVIHSVLSQPIPQKESQELLQETIKEMSLAYTTGLLGQLNQFRPELTMRLANSWLEQHPINSDGDNFQTISDKLIQLTDSLLLGEIYTLAGQFEKAEGFKSRSLKYLNTFQSEIANQMIGETLRSKNIELSLSLWTKASTPAKLSPPAGLVINLLQAGRIEDSLTLLPETDGNTQTPLRWLNNIYQALEQKDINQARLFAYQTLNSFIESYNTDPHTNELVFGSRRDVLIFLSELIHLLSDLALYKEAVQAAQIATSIQPDDPQLLIKLSQASRSTGDDDISIQAAELAVALNPLNPEYRRQLAKSLESAGHWKDSLPERQVILEHRFAQPDVPAWPTSADLLALADCSLHADQPQQAFEVCQKAIDLNPSNGHAHAILGEALSALGQDNQAMEHFTLATQLAPHEATPWLSLSNAYQRTDQREKSIETLRTASHAVPNDPTIFFALGQMHLREDSPTQAQAALGKAYELVSRPNVANSEGNSKGINRSNAEVYARDREQQCKIALAYGNTLDQLGHSDQAIQVYESAYQAYPSFPGLAYTYAKALLEKGKEGAAIAPLAIAVAAKPKQPQPYIEYAHSLLSAKEHPGEAVQALERALEIIETDQTAVTVENPNETREKALALLAQAQEAAGDLQSSLHTYSLALESNLAKNEQWKSTLAVGMGRVALKLDQPEVAIAALQDANRGEIQDTTVAQILSDAYAAISLTQEALFAARTAVHLAPDDVEILAWFAERAVRLGVIGEAIPALTRAAQLDPQRTDLIIHLGNVHARMGKTDQAREAYLSALSSPYAQPEHLYQAADGLSDLGEDESAANCLERALELQPRPPLSLILDLANAYDSSGKTELALTTIDRGIDLDSENIILHTFKANLLAKLERYQAAQACLEHALILNPDDPQTHLQIAFVLRQQGDLIRAYDHANAAVKNLDSASDTSFEFAVRGLAAELARATLQDDLSGLITTPMPQQEDQDSKAEIQPSSTSLFAYYCLLAEFSLDQEEQIAAAAALNEAYTLEPGNPRAIALQSRMALRRGDRSSALESLQAAIDNITDTEVEDLKGDISPIALLGIAMAAIDLYQWDLALEILDKASSISPNESFIILQKARLFVLRAEFQRLCQTMDIVTHAPGAQVLSPRTFRIFEDIIQDTVNSLTDDLQVENPGIIQQWRCRGMVAFQPTQETIKTLGDLSLEPSAQAALVSALSYSGDSPTIAKLYHTLRSEADSETLHYRIQAAYALSISMHGQDEINADGALEAILSAIEQCPTDPVYYVIQARLAEILGDNLGAYRAMQTALTIWPDEPRWQAYTAQISLLNEDFLQGINHLEEAISIEPNQISHYLAIGDAHLRSGQVDCAIKSLKQAVKVAPEQVEPYLALASAQYFNQDYTQAIKNAKSATIIAPEQVRPLLLNAEISLKMNDPGQAKTQAEAALRIKPDDPDALHLQARALEDLGHTERALSIIEKAIPLSDDPLPLLLQRAQLRARFDDPQAILGELQEIADHYPDEPMVLAPLAEALAQAGQKEESIQAAQQALHRGNGHLPPDEQARLHHLLGLLLRQSGQLDQSIHQLSEAIRVSPDRLETYLELGITQEERRQYSLALDTYKQAISIYPADPRPYYQAGILLKASRDYPAAESMLRRAAEMAPDDVTIHRQLAALVALNLVHNRQPA